MLVVRDHVLLLAESNRVQSGGNQGCPQVCHLLFSSCRQVSVQEKHRKCSLSVTLESCSTYAEQRFFFKGFDHQRWNYLGFLPPIHKEIPSENRIFTVR